MMPSGEVAQTAKVKSAEPAVRASIWQALLLADERTGDPGSRKLSLLMKCLVLAGSLAWAAWLFHPMLRSEFWYQDDHELVRFLRDGHSRLTISDGVKALVEQTEVGKTLSSARYRPTYYTLRVAELYLWHLHAPLWFAARFCMVLVSLALFIYLGMEFVGPLCGALLVFVALTPLYWADTWGRTSPAEQYATLGAALFLIGVAGFFKSPIASRAARWPVWFIVAGCILAGGSKEDFVPTFVVPGLCLLVPRLRRRLRGVEILGFSVATAFGLLIVWTVYSGIVHNGGNTVYGQHPDASYLERVVDRFVELAIPYLELMISAQVIAGVVGLARRADRGPLWTLHRRFMLSMVLGLGLLFWVVLFYAGDWPTFRYPYDFPGLLLAPACVGLCLFLLDRTFAITRLGGMRILLSLVAAAALIGYIYDARFPWRPLLTAYADRSHRYQEDIARISKQAGTHPAYPIVFSVSEPLNGEAVFATRIFLYARGTRNPFYIISTDLIRAAGNNPHWLGAARELDYMAAGHRGFLDNKGLAGAIQKAGGAYLIRVSPQGPPLEGAIDLLWLH